MCGIAGIYPGSARSEVDEMLGLLRHRGPDGCGVIDSPGGTLGHTRLAIVDPSGGHQPMQVGQSWISFNGEVYNHADLRLKYLRGKRTLRSRTDTEVVLHLYTLLGPACVKLFEGMFAIAIMQDGELFLARDPLGIKALYFARKDDKLYFASEIKALTPISQVVHEFPAGYWYHSRLGWQQYFHLDQVRPQEDQFANSEEASRQIFTTLAETVQSQLMSDAPLGVSLSGGLDSSVVAQLANQGSEKLYSFAVGVEGSPDLLAAHQVADFLGTRHFELRYTEDDMLKALPKVLYALESFDPSLVRSAIPNYFLAKLASEHVKVILTGEGADELYAGYEYLADFTEAEALERELIHITNALHNTNLQRADRISMAWGLEARPPFLDTRSVRLAFQIPADWKLTRPGRPAKHLLRRAFSGLLPNEIIQRPKQKFSQGAGSARILAQRAKETISDGDFAKEKERLKAEWDFDLKNKEALYYYRKASTYYADEVLLPGMGQSRSL